MEEQDTRSVGQDKLDLLAREKGGVCPAIQKDGTHAMRQSSAPAVLEASISGTCRSDRRNRV